MPDRERYAGPLHDICGVQRQAFGQGPQDGGYLELRVRVNDNSLVGECSRCGRTRIDCDEAPILAERRITLEEPRVRSDWVRTPSDNQISAAADFAQRTRHFTDAVQCAERGAAGGRVDHGAEQLRDIDGRDLGLAGCAAQAVHQGITLALPAVEPIPRRARCIASCSSSAGSPFDAARRPRAALLVEKPGPGQFASA